MSTISIFLRFILRMVSTTKLTRKCKKRLRRRWKMTNSKTTKSDLKCKKCILLTSFTTNTQPSNTTPKKTLLGSNFQKLLEIIFWWSLILTPWVRFTIWIQAFLKKSSALWTGRSLQRGLRLNLKKILILRKIRGILCKWTRLLVWSKATASTKQKVYSKKPENKLSLKTMKSMKIFSLGSKCFSILRIRKWPKHYLWFHQHPYTVFCLNVNFTWT